MRGASEHPTASNNVVRHVEFQAPALLNQTFQTQNPNRALNQECQQIGPVKAKPVFLE
jgi:hypothetical protein